MKQNNKDFFYCCKCHVMPPCVAFALVLIGGLFLLNSCSDIRVNNNPHSIKYTITIQDAMPYEQNTYYSGSEIKHTKNGCIEFLDLSYGGKNVNTICRPVSIEPYP